MTQATQFLPGNAKEFDNLLKAVQVDESAKHLRPYASYYQTDPLAKRVQSEYSPSRHLRRYRGELSSTLVVLS